MQRQRSQRMTDKVYLNGEFIAADQAKVSVFDRGFLFADSVYEVIPYYQGKSFQMELHLRRLQQSLAALNIRAEHNWRKITDRLVQLNGAGNLSVYLQVTRGAGNRRSQAIDTNMLPTVFACTNAIENSYSAKVDSVAGIKVIVCEDLRWRRCDIKSNSLLPNILVMEQARLQGAQEALLQRDNIMLEGASSNLLIVEKGKLIAPDSEHAILAGTTSSLVRDLAAANGIQYKQQSISYSRLLAADEVWISSSTRGLLPVLQIDQHLVGAGAKGELWRRMYQLLAMQQQSLFEN
ncbi:MAG: aminotransferase class IV [Pseudomonadales bacterium]|nr:aminotransferase class IV [Pseudomonadales bacterium]